MTLTKRLHQFVKEVTAVATSDDKDLTIEMCVKEYSDQIFGDDYYSVVNYANSMGIKIPRALRNAIDPEY